MKAGSVIVDMAAANGGNVEGTVKDDDRQTAAGVTIIGYTDLAGRLPAQASQLYGTNVVNLMKLMTPGKDGQLVLDFDDVVQRSMTVVRNGRADVAAPARPGLRSATHADQRPGAGEGVRRQEAGLGSPAVRDRQGPAPRRCSWPEPSRRRGCWPT